MWAEGDLWEHAQALVEQQSKQRGKWVAVAELWERPKLHLACCKKKLAEELAKKQGRINRKKKRRSRVVT